MYKVLIVDDDKFLLDMYALKFSEMKDAAENQEFSVTTAMNGADALTKLSAKDFQPDIVLLDIVMPGTDGFEVLKQIKEKNLSPKSIVIVLSNLGQKEDIDKGIALGAQGYIVKASATPSEVVAKVREIAGIPAAPAK